MSIYAEILNPILPSLHSMRRLLLGTDEEDLMEGLIVAVEQSLDDEVILGEVKMVAGLLGEVSEDIQTEFCNLVVAKFHEY